ncbi:MAG: hypothetical protein IPF54_24730 [Draconibacterium sp.]|nr:hypothetical protein [Draconibacterium sp.]
MGSASIWRNRSFTFLKFKTDKNTFKIILRFAIWGTIGGGLGFGFGGFWMILGSHLPDVIFKKW